MRNRGQGDFRGFGGVLVKFRRFSAGFRGVTWVFRRFWMVSSTGSPRLQRVLKVFQQASKDFQQVLEV